MGNGEHVMVMDNTMKKIKSILEVYNGFEPDVQAQLLLKFVDNYAKAQELDQIMEETLDLRMVKTGLISWTEIKMRYHYNKKIRESLEKINFDVLFYALQSLLDDEETKERKKTMECLMDLHKLLSRGESENA